MKYTVQCGFADYYANTVTVEAKTFEQACELAMQEAGNDSDWKAVCHAGDTFIDAIGEGDSAWPEPGEDKSKFKTPEAYSEGALWHESSRLLIQQLAEFHPARSCRDLAGDGGDHAALFDFIARARAIRNTNTGQAA